jgi:hypothetical protein
MSMYVRPCVLLTHSSTLHNNLYLAYRTANRVRYQPFPSHQPTCVHPLCVVLSITTTLQPAMITELRRGAQGSGKRDQRRSIGRAPTTRQTCKTTPQSFCFTASTHATLSIMEQAGHLFSIPDTLAHLLASLNNASVARSKTRLKYHVRSCYCVVGGWIIYI